MDRPTSNRKIFLFHSVSLAGCCIPPRISLQWNYVSGWRWTPDPLLPVGRWSTRGNGELPPDWLEHQASGNSYRNLRLCVCLLHLRHLLAEEYLNRHSCINLALMKFLFHKIDCTHFCMLGCTQRNAKRLVPWFLSSYFYAPEIYCFCPVCHSVFLSETLLITFEQWLLELWYFTWIFPVIRTFRGYHYFLPCDLDLGVWSTF